MHEKMVQSFMLLRLANLKQNLHCNALIQLFASHTKCIELVCIHPPCFSFSFRGSQLYILNPFSIPQAKHPATPSVRYMEYTNCLPWSWFHPTNSRPFLSFPLFAMTLHILTTRLHRHVTNIDIIFPFHLMLTIKSRYTIRIISYYYGGVQVPYEY